MTAIHIRKRRQIKWGRPKATSKPSQQMPVTRTRKFNMSTIKACDLSDNALLNVYAKTESCYTDCYATDIRAAVNLSSFVTMFYTTPLFRLERVVLKLAVSKPSTDRQARQLGEAKIDHFAAWKVEQRTEDQLLMCDMSGRTRSWFMVDFIPNDSGPKTRLYFGSAVVPVMNDKTGELTLGQGFVNLLGFHKLYSRALLSAAKSRLGK